MLISVTIILSIVVDLDMTVSQVEYGWSLKGLGNKSKKVREFVQFAHYSFVYTHVIYSVLYNCM